MSWTMNPKTFSAEVTIMGKARGVAFDGEALMIGDMSPQEAVTFLEALHVAATQKDKAQPAVAPADRKPAPASANSEMGVTAPKAPMQMVADAQVGITPAPAAATTSAVDPAAKPPRKPQPPLTDEQKAKRVAALAKAREVKAAKLAAGKPKAEVVNSEGPQEGSHTVETGLNAPVKPAAEEDDFAEEIAEDKAEQEAAKAASHTGDPAADSVHAAKLATLSKIGEVVSYLHDSGFHSVADKIALCGRVREQVPVLQRVPNLDERIGRAQEVMGLDG